MHRLLLFRGQDLKWQEQIRFTELLGEPFFETRSINRKKHPKIPDPRLGYFSNDPSEGLKGIGTEGWHVDGNVVEGPHLVTILHCINASKHGPTLFVPLKEVVDLLSQTERRLLETVSFVSGHNSSIVQPLLYKNPYRNDDTIMLALGELSGQYLQLLEDGTSRIMSVEETKFIQDILEAKILKSNLIYAHDYQQGDVLIWTNNAVAHVAGPGSQGALGVSGLRLMHRSSVKGIHVPNKKTNIHYECGYDTPFKDGYCFFSLKDSVYYPVTGAFDTIETARHRCRNVNKYADLATIPNETWNELAKKVISRAGVPHWVNSTNPTDLEVYWGEEKSEYSNWDPDSEQPNDCLGEETCIVLGPHGYWFDFTCGPKTYPGADLGPVMTWEDGTRKEFNVYPMCGVALEHKHHS